MTKEGKKGDMARVFITGSADGLGKMAAEQLVAQGHAVVMHARSEKRASEMHAAVPGAETVVVGDLSSIEQTRRVADAVNALGAFDAVIHNAGVGYQEPTRNPTADGFPTVFAVNTLAPYILSALIAKPKRLIYLSSGLHTGGDASLADLTWTERTWHGMRAYSDTKFHDVLIAFAFARHWPDVYANALEPGWVATKMGGPGAPDDLDAGAETQAWLAVSDDATAKVTAEYFFHKKLRKPNPATRNEARQDRLIAALAEMSGVPMP